MIGDIVVERRIANFDRQSALTMIDCLHDEAFSVAIVEEMDPERS